MDYNVKTSDIEAKYFTTSDYDKFKKWTIETKIKEKWLVDKSSISGLKEYHDLNKKLVTVATKSELRAAQDKTVIKSIFFNKSHFEDDDTQNYLDVQPVCRYYKKLLIAVNFSMEIKRTVW